MTHAELEAICVAAAEAGAERLRTLFGKPREIARKGRVDLVTYDDFRAALGLEFKRCSGVTGFVEGGYAFERHLYYASNIPDGFRPQSVRGRE